MMLPKTVSLCLLVLAACQSSTSTPPAAVAPQASRPDAESLLARARELVAAGEPYEALVILDEAQAAAPQRADVWYLRGSAAMAAAERGTSAADFYIDAQRAFERAAQIDGHPDALLGASRAARMNLESARALELAREAEAAHAATSPRVTLEQPLERTLIEALFGVYVERRQAEEDAAELFGETEDRLTRMAVRDPADAWAWTQLANLYQWEGQAEEALAAYEHLLELQPDDSKTHDRFIQLARAAGGRPAVLAGYERFAQSHPDHPLGAWFVAMETFQAALADLRGDRESIPGFRAAEALFAHCRELEPSYAASSRGYEVMCRDGVAWALYGKGDLDGARDAFLSMEEVLEGGLEWQLEGSLLSGVTGLQFVADRYVQRGEGEFDLVGKREAAEIFDLLRAYRPGDVNFANNAGFFHRDACVILELSAQEATRYAQGKQRVRRDPEAGDVERSWYVEKAIEVTPAEAEKARQDAAELRAEATRQAAASYEAYVAAAELSPEDVRVLNDAALVMVYHTRSDVPQMEALLQRAIELGERQVQDPELSAEDLDALLEAWGDAHQNMGLLYLTLKDDPQGARPYFEKSFEIGPRPRVDRAWVEKQALMACERAEAGDPDALVGLDPRIWLHVRP